MNDEILDLVRGGVAPLHMDRPLDAIEARARTLRRRRTLTGAAGGSVTAGLALTVALTALGGPAGPVGPAGVSARGGTTATPSAGSLRPVGFAVAVASDDTVTVTFQQVMVDPTVLEKALADAGIPAKVWVDATCTGVAGFAPGGHRWVDTAVTFDEHGPDGQPTLIIRKTKVPKGVILGLGFSRYRERFIRLSSMVFTTGSSLTCSPVRPTTAPAHSR